MACADRRYWLDCVRWSFLDLFMADLSRDEAGDVGAMIPAAEHASLTLTTDRGPRFT